MVTELPPADPLAKRLLDDHLGSVLASVTFLFVAIRILVVSGYDIATAIGLVTATDTGALLLGTLLLDMGLLAAGATALVMYQCETQGGVDQSSKGLARLGKALSLVTALFVPILGGLMLLYFVATGPKGIELGQRLLGPILRAVFGASKSPTSAAERSIRWLIVFSVGASAAVAVLVDTRPWLPAEELTFKSGAVATVFVLKADEGDTVVLAERNRRLIRITSDVTRSFCRLDGLEYTLARPLLSTRPPYPKCRNISAPAP